MRTQTFQKLGCKFKVSAYTKKELDRLKQVAHTEHTKALEHFRDNLNSGQSFSTHVMPRQETITYRRSRYSRPFWGVRGRHYQAY